MLKVGDLLFKFTNSDITVIARPSDSTFGVDLVCRALVADGGLMDLQTRMPPENPASRIWPPPPFQDNWIIMGSKKLQWIEVDEEVLFEVTRPLKWRKS